jgi:hypothetical protein
MVMRRSAVVAVAVVVVVAGAFPAARAAAAQRRTLDRARMGPHIGYNFDADALTLGAQMTLPLLRQLDVYPSFDYYFVDPGTLWALNADLKFRPATRRGALYVGGGLNYLRASAGGGTDDTDVNLLAGVEARRRVHAPYLEARLMLGNGSAFQIVGGFNFLLH